MAKVSAKRIQERNAVNATRALFESAGHIVDERGSGSDFGEDLVVSFVENGERNGVHIAIQVKGGKSYRSGTGYAVRGKKHATDWRCSNIPVLCVVYDPVMQALYWENATRVLRERYAEHNSSTTIRIPASRILHEGNLDRLVNEMREFSGIDRRHRLVSAIRRLADGGLRAQRAATAPRGGYPNLLVQHLAAWIDDHPTQMRQIMWVLSFVLLNLCFTFVTPELITINSRFGYSDDWVFVGMLYSFLCVCFIVAAFENGAARSGAVPRVLGGSMVAITYFVGFAACRLDNEMLQSVTRIWLGLASIIVHFGLVIGFNLMIVQEVYRRRRLRAVASTNPLR